MIITSTIDEHINRRLARIQSQSYSNQQLTRGILRTSSDSATSGKNCNNLISTDPFKMIPFFLLQDDTESNEDLSDEGLDISQRACDNILSNDFSNEESIIGK